MRSKGEIYLILFSTGGVQFAAEAFSVRGVAEADWRPDTDPSSERKDLLCDLADLLGLSATAQKPTRTILVQTAQGTIGFTVDRISKEEITQHSIQPVPPLLIEWMRPVAVTGFFEYKDKVVGVLDFQRLAEVALLRSPTQEQPKAEPDP